TPVPCFLHRSRPHQALLSFPTRRSSDLTRSPPSASRSPCSSASSVSVSSSGRAGRGQSPSPRPECSCSRTPTASRPGSGRHRPRSEEHTSELQSRVDLVCRLLLEKQNKE